MKTIPLRNRAGDVIAETVVDDADFEALDRFRWCLSGDGYAARIERLPSGRMRQYRMHRVILGLAHGDPLVGDHRNGARLDNRRENLRAVTVTENAQRRGPRVVGSSSFRGVSRVAGGKWHAAVRFRDRLFHLGNWDSEEEAARIAAAVRGALMPYSQEADAA